MSVSVSRHHFSEPSSRNGSAPLFGFSLEIEDVDSEDEPAEGDLVVGDGGVAFVLEDVDSFLHELMADSDVV